MTIPLQIDPVYGPVQSRRLGRSLGLNILSTEQKTCSLNCLYCQYGLDQLSETELANPYWYTPTNLIADALERRLFTIKEPPEYITFSGNGESTLHPQFKEIVQSVREIRDKYSPSSQLALLSNSSTVHRSSVRETLALFDHRIMKFDCGDEATFIIYNQPEQTTNYYQIFEGLKEIPDITIQALFAKGKSGNYREDLIDGWIEKIIQISPRDVQIYTLDRSYASKDITPVSREDLNIINTRALKAGINITVY